MNHTDNNEWNNFLGELFARPDWESCPDCSLEVGSDYVYSIGDDAFSSLAIRGHVLFNNGVTAVLQVIDRNAECDFMVLDYDEVRQFIPEFHDTDTQKIRKEYLCLDVETESCLFDRNPETDTIGEYHYDENGKWVFTPLDPYRFRMDRIKKLFTFRIKEMERERDLKQKSYDSTITVELPEFTIDEMYQEYDQQHGNLNSDNVLYHGLNRSIHWLTHCNCATITAWRGKFNRKENDERNSKLQQKLRALGYGLIRVKGCYAEIGKPLEHENSFMVFDFDDTDNFMQNIYELSEYYEQDCFLYKPKDEEVAYLIGTNDDFGKGIIELAGFMRINSKTASAFTKVASGTISFEKNCA